MHHYCTYFDSVYAPRGLIMIGSLFRHQPDAVVHVLCLDETCQLILKALEAQIPRVKLISVEELEQYDPELAACKDNRTKIEYYFTCTPCLPAYVYDKNPDITDLTYLDADLYFYQSPDLIFDEIGDKSIAITPHKFSPLHKPSERYGIFNVAWITWRNDEIGRKCLADYRRNCIAWCYDREEDGKFGDQKYLDSWPKDYGSVAILDHKGINVALWNVENYDIQKKDGVLYIDEQLLIFFHFHAVHHFGPGEFYVPFRESGVQKDVDRLVELLYQPYTDLVEMTGKQLSPDGSIKFHGSKRYPISNLQSGQEEADSPWRGKRVLVAGGLGFIGSTLARKLADAGADVVVLDSLLPDYGGHRFNLESYGADPHAGRIRVNISDLRDQTSLARLVEDREVVFNLAAQLGHMASMQDPLTDLDINARAVVGLLELCRALPDCRVIYASTRQVYGRPQYLPVDEKHPVVPVDVNAINKIAGEHYHTLYSQVHGMKTAVLRMTNVYGPRMRIKDARQTFLGIWIRSALENKPFELWGGEQLRDLTYVDDAVDALMRLALEPQAVGKIFNLGGAGGPSKLKDLAAEVTAAAGGSFVVKPFPEDRKAIDIGDFYSDDSLFRSLTGWAPQISLQEGLRRTVEYYRQHFNIYV